jgi:cytidyltransferase-like protein
MQTIIITCGYFNPIHLGHINLFREAKAWGDYLAVIINNDKQQVIKKGKVIINEQERAQIVKAVRYVDEVILSIDQDATQGKTLAMLGHKFKGKKIIFAKGGDRAPAKDPLPESEIKACQENNIEIKYEVGGSNKVNSSSAINKSLGIEH